MTALSPRDLEEIRRRGADAGEVLRQIRLLRHPPAPPRLLRPCRVGDGIRRLEPDDHGDLLAAGEEAARRGRVSRFVPASGAATRMFRGPLEILGREGAGVTRGALEERARAGDGAAQGVLALLEGLPRLPFHAALVAAMREADRDLEGCRRRCEVGAILACLLQEDGLAYASLPKGLIPFHRYPEGPRTAFAEHLAEGARHLADSRGDCRLHFTVPAGGVDAFEAELAAVAPTLEAALGVRFQVGFSVQDPATDTVAVDPGGKPFRREDGALLFRPGGHGALLGNLEAAGGDLVTVKNVDNVVPDALQETTARWKRLLTGLLARVQARVFDHLERLGEGADSPALAAAAAFAAAELSLAVPGELAGEDLRRHLVDRLDRPLRVCGMVENRGEPGGGPFWVAADGDGAPRLQIVEAAQIAPDQSHLLTGATHFNPVDLALGLRDRRGRPYPLARFADPDAVFVARKSLAGRELLALERPGLWNGAMAGWNTLFVEVPAATFAPVKTVLDLLRPEHQGGGPA